MEEDHVGRGDMTRNQRREEARHHAHWDFRRRPFTMPHAARLLSQLDSQREWGFLCDVLVAIGDTQFRAHRCVLAACSALFRMMFTHTDSRGQQRVDLSHTGLSATSFDRVLQYMYRGSISTVDSLDFEDLKSSMQQLQMFHVPQTLEELRPDPGPDLGPNQEGPRPGPETNSSTGNSRPISVEELLAVAPPPGAVAPPPGPVAPPPEAPEPCDLRRPLRRPAERLRERPRFGRTFTCDDCGFVFSCEKLLIEHILTCTNRKNPPGARDQSRDTVHLFHTDTESSPDSNETRVKSETEDWTRSEPGPATVKIEVGEEPEPGPISAKRIKLEPGLDQDPESRCELCGLQLEHQEISSHLLSCHTSHMCACGRCGQVLIKGRQLQEHAQRCAQNQDQDQDQDQDQNLDQDLDQTSDQSQDPSQDPSQEPDLPDLQENPENQENPEEESEEEEHEDEDLEALQLMDNCENAGASLAGLMPAAFSLEDSRRRHFCGICGRGFFQRCHLREHYTVHTKHKQFSCNTCGKGFLRQRQLRLHQDMHQGVARYVCPVCEQGTFLKQDHVRHMISHLSPGETICQVCFQMFPGLEQLEQHMEVHLYVCSVCGDKFRLRKDMKTHCSSVHNKRI
uniref:Uncharacterized protein n=1 Tax=Knipowitschia caucasica TaxID=637954 RepID=A0AAV2KDN6_KNICA